MGILLLAVACGCLGQVRFQGCDPQTDRIFINNSFRYLQNNVHGALEYVVQIVFELFYTELPVQNYNPQRALLNE